MRTTPSYADEWIRSQDPIGSITTTIVGATRRLHSGADPSTTRPTTFDPWVWESAVADAPGVDLHTFTYGQSCAAMRRVADMTYESIATTHPQYIPSTSAASDRIGRRAIERGVANHAVAHGFGTTVLTDPKNTPRDTYVITPSATLDIRVADGRIGVVSRGHGRSGLLVSTQPRLVRACSRYIQAARSIGRPVQPGWKDPTISPTVRQLQILRLLAAGETDASSGVKLSVSERLVRREIADLYTMFNVRSRFELGVAYSTWMAGS